MKRLLLFLYLLCFTLIFTAPTELNGLWVTEKSKKGKQLIVKFYQKNNRYYGKIIGLISPEYPLTNPYTGKDKLDLANPDKELQKRSLVGSDFVSNFSYNEKENRLEDGLIYNPENGKTYYCSITIKDKNNLIVKGSLDKMGWFGVKQDWKRIK